MWRIGANAATVHAMHDSASNGNANGANAGTLALTVPEVSRELRIGVRSAWALVHSGKLPSIKVGKSRRVEREALEQYVRGLREAS